MTDVAYIACLAAQEAAYWEARRQGMNLTDKQIGDLLRVAAPIILAEAGLGAPRGMKAVIVKKGRCAEDGYTEPQAQLEDGRVIGMGRNLRGPIYEVGTIGTAEYVADERSGLWRFTPDEERHDG